MKYSIVYDKPQRIRFRCGAYAFDKAYEGCIYNFLIEKNYVKKVEVNSENGGILVMYDKGYRQNVIDVIASIERSSLVDFEHIENVMVITQLKQTGDTKTADDTESTKTAGDSQTENSTENK